MLVASWMLALTCSPGLDPDAAVRGRELVQRTVKAHGAERLLGACVDFDFRGFPYRMTRSRDGRFRYERRSKHGYEVLTNDDFRLRSKSAWVELSPDQASSGRQGVNSVVYFASLPLALLDPGVRPRALPPQTIEGVEHEVLDVRFTADGGGDFPNDVFRYWIDPDSGLIRYLAYQSEARGGLVRFRVATGRTHGGGVVFTDWDNYGMPGRGIALESLPERWLAGTLPKVSTIQTESLRFGCEDAARFAEPGPAAQD